MTTASWKIANSHFYREANIWRLYAISSIDYKAFTRARAIYRASMWIVSERKAFV